MRVALHLCGILALLAATVALGEVAYTLHRFRPEAELTLEHVNRATIAAGAAAGNVEKASRAWQKASQEQATQTSLAMSRVGVAAEQLSGLISNTDKSLNVSLLPAMTEAIESQNAALLTNQEALIGDLRQLAQTTIQFQSTLTDIDKTVAGPEVKETLQNTAITSKNTAAATQNLADTTADIKEGVHYELKQLEAPATKLKAVGNIALVIIRHLFF